MIVSLHVTTGAAGGALAGSRTGAFVLGLALHGLGDAVPHHDIESQGFEIGSGATALLALAARYGPFHPVTIGALAASAPDIEHVLPLPRPGGRKLFPSHRVRGLAPRGRPPRLGPARRRRHDPGRAPRLAPPVRLVVLFALVALALGAFVLVTRGNSSSSAVVARVIDGDTIELVGGERVRLVQIDTPEKREECYGDAASALTRRLLPAGTRVRIEQDPDLDQVDRYQRKLAYVWKGDEDVNVTLVREGAAGVWFYGGKQRPLREASSSRQQSRPAPSAEASGRRARSRASTRSARCRAAPRPNATARMREAMSAAAPAHPAAVPTARRAPPAPTRTPPASIAALKATWAAPSCAAKTRLRTASSVLAWTSVVSATSPSPRPAPATAIPARATTKTGAPAASASPAPDTANETVMTVGARPAVSTRAASAAPTRPPPPSSDSIAP